MTKEDERFTVLLHLQITALPYHFQCFILDEELLTMKLHYIHYKLSL